MSDEIKKRIVDYLSSHLHCRLATVTPEGVPLAHAVSYASEGATIYFMSDKTSRKMQNIMKNDRVAYTVDENYEDFFVIQGIQIEGKATVLSEQAEAEKAIGMLIKKFPQITQLPQNPNLVPVKLTPTEGYFIDYTVEFGHRDKVTF